MFPLLPLRLSKIHFSRLLFPGLYWIPLLFLLLSARAGGESATFRIATWNIEWFPGKYSSATEEESAIHMRRARRDLERIDPDLFIGVEMRDWQAFSELVSIVSGLQPVVASAYRSNRGPGFWPMQIGIASRLPVEASWWEYWKPNLGSNPRGFSLAVVSPPKTGEGVILVYGLHLKSNRAHDEEQVELNFLMREESIIQVLAHVGEMERLAYPGRVIGVIIGGDLNTNHDGQFDDSVIELLEEAGFYNTWLGVPRKERLTWRGDQDYGPTTLDYIFTRGFKKSKASLMKINGQTSDHHPVVLQVEYRITGK